MYILPSDIAHDISAEREYQINKLGYTSYLDDKWSLNDWISFIVSFAGRAFFNPKDRRATFVKVAALAVAAIEAYDRNKDLQPEE